MISVKSSQDSISTSIQSGRLGGRVTGVAFVIAAADRIPGASNKQVIVSFTIQTALVAADTITINYPEGVFALGTIRSISPSSLFLISFGTKSLVLATSWLLFPATAAITVTLSGVNMGSPAASNATGITVSTSKDFESAPVSSGPIGGQVTNVSMSGLPAMRVPASTGHTVFVTFTLATMLRPSQRVYVNWPAGFFDAGVAPTAVYGSPAFASAAAVAGTSWSIAAVDGSGAVAGTYTLAFFGVRLGPVPIAGSVNGVTVSSDQDVASAGVASGRLGGQVTDVAFVIADATAFPARATSK